MDAKRPWRRPPLRSFALGGVVGAAGAIATLRRLRRAAGVRTAAGLAAFEDAPCFLELDLRATRRRRRRCPTSGERGASPLGAAAYPSASMPIYEYKCPNGHLLEVFHGMSEPGPRKCEVCGASPLERVLFPVAVHYKGSGFYSTDYGRGGKKAARTPARRESGSGSGRARPTRARSGVELLGQRLGRRRRLVDSGGSSSSASD